MIEFHDAPIEYVWVVISVCGLVVVILSMLESRNDLKRSRRKTDLTPANRFLAHVIYFSSKIIVVVHLLMVIASICSLFLPPPPPVYQSVPQSLMVISLLIAQSAILTYHALLGRIWRRRISTQDYDGASWKKIF